MGLEEGLAEAGLKEFSLGAISIDTALTEIKEFGEKLGQSGNYPDAFVSSSAMTAIAFISGLETAGKQIGQDFDVVAKQSTMPLDWYRKEIMTIPEDFHEAGRNLARAVLALINGEDPQSLQTLESPPLAGQS